VLSFIKKRERTIKDVSPIPKNECSSGIIPLLA
jgi:hypothetical protein